MISTQSLVFQTPPCTNQTDVRLRRRRSWEAPNLLKFRAHSARAEKKNGETMSRPMSTLGGVIVTENRDKLLRRRDGLRPFTELLLGTLTIVATFLSRCSTKISLASQQIHLSCRRNWFNCLDWFRLKCNNIVSAPTCGFVCINEQQRCARLVAGSCC